ncbi:hypothetical protein PAXRUDRAFT_355009 [Paxillus rubicundulus Ve08.2h10]|uniref:Uncharacterized protein n=1 Tax=Paxillus rubicundulus Ve08.2h10 TaxID=930991 RepID=A0A0D0DIH0_9AGAM|nr:hypothetical protein PAXRUDRAFT_355009 [Paxillus rubicundulus Ve08.2h10]
MPFLSVAPRKTGLTTTSSVGQAIAVPSPHMSMFPDTTTRSWTLTMFLDSRRSSVPVQKLVVSKTKVLRGLWDQRGGDCFLTNDSYVCSILLPAHRMYHVHREVARHVRFT